MTTYGYARVSTQLQVDEGESLGVQQRQIEGWGMIQGDTIAQTFIDSGVSGAIPLAQRPEGGKLMAGIKKGDTIVAARLDRLFRSASDALNTAEAMKAKGVRVFVIDVLGDITGNGMSKAFLTISAAFSELERDTIRERVRDVKRDQRLRGRYLGGKRKFGYRIEGGELVADEEEQHIISYILERGAAGDSLRKISFLIEEDFPGKGLNKNAISRILKENNVILSQPE